MRRLLVSVLACAAIAACAAPVSGCVNTGGAPPGSPAISATTDEKALLVLEAAVQGSAIAVSTAVDSGQLKGANAAKAADALRQAKAALGAARTAYAVSDAAGFLRAKAQVETAVAEAGRLAPAK
jgi:hypothetical protein